MRKILIIILLI